MDNKVIKKGAANLVKRKIFSFIWTLFISTPIIGFCYMLVEESNLKEVPGLMLFLFIFAAPVVLFFGIPVSILSEIISNRIMGKKRLFASFVTYLFFAISFVVLFIFITESRFMFTEFKAFDWYFLLPAIIYSSVGWCVDEISRKHFNKQAVGVN